MDQITNQIQILEDQIKELTQEYQSMLAAKPSQLHAHRLKTP